MDFYLKEFNGERNVENNETAKFLSGSNDISKTIRDTRCSQIKESLSIDASTRLRKCSTPIIMIRLYVRRAFSRVCYAKRSLRRQSHHQQITRYKDLHFIFTQYDNNMRLLLDHLDHST